MIVKELISALQKLPQDLEVLTNQCEATEAHEDVVEVETIEVVSTRETEFGKPLTKYHVFVGTGEAR